MLTASRGWRKSKPRRATSQGPSTTYVLYLLKTMFQPGQDVRKPLEHRTDVDGGATGDGIGGGTARRGGQPRTRIAGRSHTLPISCENCTRRAPFNYIICYKSSVGINQYLYFGNSLSHFYCPRILPNKVVLRKKEKTTEAGVQ